MIGDTTESIDSNAWTELLDRKPFPGKRAIIVRMAGITEDNECDAENEGSDEKVPLNGEQSEEADDVRYPMNLRLTDPLKSHPIEAQTKHGNPSAGENKKLLIFSTFHKFLNRSIKAVNESRRTFERYRQTRCSSRRSKKRVVFKTGDCNVVQGNVAKRRRRYLQDIFTTLVDAQWRWTLLVFALSFLISWFLFAVIWWTIAYQHGDLDYIYRRDFQPEFVENVTHRVCVTEVRSIVSAFLYSVETQHTIGYGNRYITEECPFAIFIMCFQCITGVFIQAFMVGIVFAKLSRPKKRAQTLLFSRNAVICHRDGVPCLMFRVGDMRKSHIIEAHVRAQIFRKKVTKENEVLPYYQQELRVGADGGEDRLMFIWPTTIVHKIDRSSPLYLLSASDMLKERFEIVVMLEGVIESTGMTTQARTSYLPSEILWGHRFVNLVTFRKDSEAYEVDYTLFNNTYDVDTPLCSSKQLDDIKADVTKHTKLGLERTISTNILPRLASTFSFDHLDPASDESLDSGHLQIRSHSTQNGGGGVGGGGELEPLNADGRQPATFTMGGLTITTTAPSIPNLTSINEKPNSICCNNDCHETSCSGSHTNNNNNNTNNNNNNNNNIYNYSTQNNANLKHCLTVNSSGNVVNNSSNSCLSIPSSNGSTRTKTGNPRRLSIKQDQLSIDSMC